MNQFKRPTLLDAIKIDIKGLLAALGLIMWGFSVGALSNANQVHKLLSSNFYFSLSFALIGWLLGSILSFRKTYKEEIRHYKWRIEFQRKLNKMKREINISQRNYQ